MATTKADASLFAELLEQSAEIKYPKEGEVITGTIEKIEKKNILVIYPVLLNISSIARTNFQFVIQQRQMKTLLSTLQIITIGIFMVTMIIMEKFLIIVLRFMEIRFAR